MINRASWPLLVAYLAIFAAGTLFVSTPSPIVDQLAEYGALVLIWGMCYVAGGSIAAGSLLLRRIFRRSVSLWYFEISGLALIITANLIYAYALFRIGQRTGEDNITAISLVVLAFSAGLIARCIETLKLVKILRKVSLTPGS